MRVLAREACPIHGTWVCDACGWKRQWANRLFHEHECHQCGSTVGTMRPLYHHNLWRTQECAQDYARLIDARDGVTS